MLAELIKLRWWMRGFFWLSPAPFGCAWKSWVRGQCTSSVLMLASLPIALLIVGFFCGVAVGRGSPAISPAALQRAFTQIGLAPGAIRTIEGTTYRVDKVSVTSDGEWIVVRVLPRRVSGR